MSQTKVKSGLLNFPDQTDFVKLPSGTTAQRPSSPEKGYSRYNTTDNKLEYWNGTEWQQLPGLTPPIITSISYPGDDLAADPAGGQTITINGGDFKAGLTVTVGGTTPSVITFVSATEITFTAPAKTAGDYNVVVTNVDGGNATAVDGMTYNGLPSWTTPAGNLGTFAAGSTIPTITLVATEPDSGVVSYSVTTGALPTGLALTGADIDGTLPTPAGETTYNFSVTASDDENQESTERAFNIVVYLQVINIVSDLDPFGDSSGVALYKLENNPDDESGLYDGAATNVTYGSGVFGQAGIFNGSSSKISNSNIVPLSSATEMSVSIWFKRYDTGVQRGVMSIGQDGAPGGGIFLLAYGYSTIGSGELFFELGSGIGRYIFTGTTDTNKWYHIAISCDGNTVNNYLNGSLQGSSSQGIGTVASSAILNIGGMNVSGGKYHNGEIDQTRIFNRALTPLEVESLYRERTVVCGGQADTLDILGDNSCVATYQLNGNANDLSGNYSGTPTNVSYGVGEFDLAGVFNGSSSYVNLGDPTSGMTTANYSVSFWVNTTSTSNSYLISKYLTDGLDSTDIFRVMNLSDGTIRFRTSTTNPSARDINSTSSVNNGNWNHILFTVEPNVSKLYINGTEEGSSTTGTAVAPTTVSRNVTLGRHDGGDNYFNGSIDQVRIFNKALSAGEVTTLYNETACDALACGGTTNTLDILSDGSCVAAYPLDGSPLDLSGNYNGVQTDVTYPVGKFDLAGSFNGTSSYVELPSGIIPSNNFSFSLWFKTNDITTSQYILGFRNTLKTYILLNATSNGSIRAVAGQNLTVDSASVVSANTWYHLSVTQSSTSGVTVYLNNSVVASNPSYTGDLVIVTGKNLIGANYGTSLGGVFNGSIDQVRVFDKALSAGEVTTLYNETACN